MTDKLRELNETYYELYGRLYENGEQLTKEQRDSIAAKLLAEYESEYEVLRLKEEIARARELYELRLKSAELIPRTWRVLHIFRRKYNRAAIQSGAEVAAEVERYFAGREAALYAAEHWGWKVIRCCDGSDPYPPEQIHQAVLAEVEAWLRRQHPAESDGF